MANQGQRGISIVPIFVPTLQTDWHMCATASHMLVGPLSCSFSVVMLKMRELYCLARLPWAQEASDSNPDAPTKNISRVFFYLLKAPFTSPPHLWNSGRQEVWSRKSFSLREFATWRICKNMRRQECYTESIERREVKPALFGKYGENLGDPTHFSSHWIIGTANQ